MVVTPAVCLTATEQPPKMSYEEFLAWAGDDIRAEWVDGEVIVFMPTGRRHVLLVGFLGDLISFYVRLRRLGLVVGEPFQFFTRGGRASRRPDVAVILTAHLDRLTAAGMEGVPDLVVEVISEGGEARDRQDKRREYSAAGVPEYWIVDGREGRHGVTFYELQPDGSYTELRPDDRGRLHSRVLSGFWLDPDWLAGNELPDLFEVLAEIATDASAEFQALARAMRSGGSTIGPGGAGPV